MNVRHENETDCRPEERSEARSDSGCDSCSEAVDVRENVSQEPVPRHLAKAGRNAKGQFIKGLSGNPGGYKGGKRSLTSILKDLLAEPYNGDGKTRGDRLMEIACKMAESGNYNFFREIMERIEGKVPDRVQATLSAGWEMVYDEPDSCLDADVVVKQQNQLEAPDG